MSSRVYVENRVRDVANYIIESGATIRQTADVFGVSRSTIHVDISRRLLDMDSLLFKKVSAIMEQHKEIRAIRGGEATRRRYAERKKVSNTPCNMERSCILA